MTLLAEQLRQLDLMSLTRLTSSHQHQSTVINGQWSIVLAAHPPVLKTGFGRTDRTNAVGADPLILVFNR
jgi:hypothetical protein